MAIIRPANNITSRIFPYLLVPLASALLLALAMPGRIGCWPLLFFALTPLLLTLLDVRPRRAALIGFLFGLVYHLAMLYWIMIVLGRYGGLSWWISLGGLLLLSSYMALYTALFAFLLSYLTGCWRQSKPSLAAMVWIAPTLWVGCEYLRSVVISGFPWMDLGYGLFSQPRLIQAADLGGHHLISFVLVLYNALIAVIIIRQRDSTPRNTSKERIFLLLACCFLIFIVGYSISRHQSLQPMLAQALKARVLVVQGNIEQSVKWSPAMRNVTLDTYLGLSMEALEKEKSELVIWPESALPFHVQDDYRRFYIHDFTSSFNTWLLVGVPFYERREQPDGNAFTRYFNAALLIGPQGKDGGRYYKQHLVPFGEYVPLERFLPFLAPLVMQVGDFSAGDAEQEPLNLDHMRLAPLICYESIFPSIARNFTAKGATILINISNDAWYGRSSAPYQSMAMAAFRAVENKRCLVRAANTGISGFINPLGEISGQTEIFVEAAKSGLVPLLTTQTIFTGGGFYFGLTCCLLMPVLALCEYRRRKTKQEENEV